MTNIQTDLETEAIYSLMDIQKTRASVYDVLKTDSHELTLFRNREVANGDLTIVAVSKFSGEDTLISLTDSQIDHLIAKLQSYRNLPR